MSDFTIAVSATVVGGIIVYLLQRIIDGPIRDRLSIRKKHIENVGNDHTEDIAIKTSGPLSLKGRPVYIQNTGIIKSIIINEHQRDNVEIVPSRRARRNKALDPTALLGASGCKHPVSPAMLAGQRRD
jgi:hypothetical protein